MNKRKNRFYTATTCTNTTCSRLDCPNYTPHVKHNSVAFSSCLYWTKDEHAEIKKKITYEK